MGTVCHAVLEKWVTEGHHLLPLTDLEAYKLLRDFYEVEHYKLFPDRDRLDEGYELVKKWWHRQDWSGRTVLSCEVKKSFDVPTSQGVIPFNYVLDRIDKLDDGTIEVVDYKTSVITVQPEDLFSKVQARCYGLAAQIEHPEAPRVWVTFDMLRYEPVGVVFSREDNIETWKYLKGLAERILASDGTRETLNDMCRFCVRRHACETLNKHADGGGVFGLTDPGEAADRRFELAGAAKAIGVMIDELDQLLLKTLEETETFQIKTDKTVAKVSSRRTRFVDSASAVRELGPEKLARFMKLGVTAVDELCKPNNPVLTSTEKAALKELVRDSYGNPSIQCKPVKQ